jgi:hypothetical protein
MGDTGSLAIGGLLGATAVATKHEIVFAVIGGLFVLEALSVIIQVASFKLTGKRVFKMAPIHHHFEQLGWTEPQVVIRFWIISWCWPLAGPRHAEAEVMGVSRTAHPPPSAGEGQPAEGRQGEGAFPQMFCRLNTVEPRLRAFARGQRSEMPRAEAMFWREVRAGRLHGTKWKRQVPTAPCIVDFLCPAARLVVELDGRPHDAPEQRAKDGKRHDWPPQPRLRRPALPKRSRHRRAADRDEGGAGGVAGGL